LLHLDLIQTSFFSVGLWASPLPNYFDCDCDCYTSWMLWLCTWQ